MPWSRLLSVAVVLAGCGLSACSTDEAAPPAATSNAARLVGRVGSVSSDRRFVAIQSYGRWSVASGTVLTTRGPDERTANLLVTGEALGRFAAADVQAGAVEVGDGVYAPPATEPVPPEPPADDAPVLPSPAPNPPPTPSKPAENTPGEEL